MNTRLSTSFDDCGSIGAGTTLVERGGFFMEEWRDVPGYPGVQASTDGNICQDYRMRPLSLTGKGYKKGRGYLATKIKIGGKSKLLKAHRLVALAFHPNVDGKPQINHIDGKTVNNRPENLEWCDPSHNLLHAIRTGLIVPLKGDKIGTAKITTKLARRIYSDVHEMGMRHRDVATKYNISKSQVTRIASKQSWAHIHE